MKTALPLALTIAAIGDAEPRRPVMVGGSPEVDACGSIGVVARLKEVDGNFLAVRSGPRKNFKAIDKLTKRKRLYLCDYAASGAWIGLVYGPPDSNCGVTSPIGKRRPYQGLCKSGWVRADWVDVIAG